MAPHGADVSHQSRIVSRYGWTDRFSRDYPDWDETRHQITAERRIALFCEEADFVIGADSSLARFLPRNDLLFKYFPVDCEEIRSSDSTSNSRPIIAHAPNHRLTKGTDFLLQSVENLRGRGVELELMLVERIPHDEALYHYREADIIADQFCIGAFGMFALEGLALGKPVLTYLDQEHLGDPVFNLPLVNTNADNKRSWQSYYKFRFYGSASGKPVARPSNATSRCPPLLKSGIGSTDTFGGAVPSIWRRLSIFRRSVSHARSRKTRFGQISGRCPSRTCCRRFTPR